jgi:peptidyl-prolyl cis-trans isomerase C
MKHANSVKYDPSFAKAVQALKKVGELSPPVRTKFGYHIIKLERAVPDHQLSFEEAKPQIIARLRADFVDKYKRDLVDRLRNEKLDADPEAVAALRTRYERPAAAPPAATATAPAKDGAPSAPNKSH